jgi:hypothetical protein
MVALYIAFLWLSTHFLRFTRARLWNREPPLLSFLSLAVPCLLAELPQARISQAIHALSLAFDHC